MTAVLSLLVVLSVSIIVMRIATVALLHTGLSREAAQFQVRSAFTGVGFTTGEAETVVNHPVRRRIVMFLMLVGNVGIVSAMASLLLTFIKTDAAAMPISSRIVVLCTGLALLWIVGTSRWVDRGLSHCINWALRRWTHIGVRDYTSLLRISEDYQLLKMPVKAGGWLENKSLKALGLADEGVIVVGIQRADGSYVGAPHGRTVVETGDTLILYGREPVLEDLERRRSDLSGDEAHDRATAEHEAVVERQDRMEEIRRGR